MTRPSRMDEAMAVGTARYADIIATLTSVGLPTVFTQTGGMCAALEVTLEAGQHLLITDAEDSLSQSSWRASRMGRRALRHRQRIRRRPPDVLRQHEHRHRRTAEPRQSQHLLDEGRRPRWVPGVPTPARSSNELRWRTPLRFGRVPLADVTRLGPFPLGVWVSIGI